MSRIVLRMNYDRKPKRREQSLTLPHHLRGVTLFISRIISSTHIHFLIPVLIINTWRIFTCSSGSVRRVPARHLRHTFGSRALHSLLSPGPERAGEVLSTHPSMVTLPLSSLASPRPLLFQILEGQCSVFKEKKGKKRAPVSKLCLFADGMSKKKHLINQNGQERLLFFRELAYLSSSTPFLPPSLFFCPLPK